MLFQFDMANCFVYFPQQDLYCVRSDLGNLLKALNRLDEAKVHFLCNFAFSIIVIPNLMHALIFTCDNHVH